MSKGKININEQDKAVSALLAQKGVKYSVVFTGSKTDKGWERDSFMVGFNDQFFEFNTGIGHRVESKFKIKTEELKTVTGLDCVVFESIGKVNHDRSRVIQHIIAPTQASVLYCLLLDATANDCSFNDWCDEYGCDSDSFSAFNNYQACCESGSKLRKVFDRETVEQLHELLADY